jgi:hypothetical protein
MVVGTQEKYRNELSFHDTLEQHSDFPRLIALKIDAQRRGVHYTEQALAHIDPQIHQLRTSSLFGSRDNSFQPVPQSLLLRDGTSVLADPTPLSQDPYIVDWDGDQFVLKEGDTQLEQIEIWRQPDYYRQVSASGVPLEHIVSARPQRLNVMQSSFCYFWAEEDGGCKYCDINTHNQAQQSQLRVPPQLRLQELTAAVGEALKEPGRFTAICLTGGSVLKGAELFDREVQLYIDTLQAIGENFTTRKFPSQLIASAFTEKQLIRLYEETGLTSYTTDLEVLDESLFNWICPGKAKHVGYQEWRRRLIAAVDIFGRGNVGTGIVGGVELAQPHGFKTERDALLATLDEAEALAEKGVTTVHTVWVPRPGSQFHAQRAPSLDYYIRLAKGLQALRAKYGLDITFDDYRRCGNHPDSDLARLQG